MTVTNIQMTSQSNDEAWTPYQRSIVNLYKPNAKCIMFSLNHLYLLLTGSEEREVSRVGSIPVAILPSCQDMKTIAL